MSAGRTNALPSPGLLWGPYPERRTPRREGLAALAKQLSSRLALPGTLLRRRYRDFVRRVGEYRASWSDAPESVVAERRRSLQPLLGRDGLRADPLAEIFALVILQCQHQLGITPFDSQIMAARAMLDNQLVEMATGEGKTVAVAIAASVAALAGIPVHVITANDYLVDRDAEHLGPLYAALGLSVGRVTGRADAGARQSAYARDVVYCTAKEVGFDYLRDRLAGKRRGDDLHRRVDHLAGAGSQGVLLRGLCMAIVDEADSVLIDEARVPLILSRATDNSREAADYAQALDLAGRLAEGRDFELDHEARRVSFGDTGAALLAEAAETLPAVWRNRRYREEWVQQALGALHLYRRDRDYIVREGRVDIVDPTTGRVAVGRSWSRGLHQLIELKEACTATPGHAVAAQITFQRLFRRYHRLAGLSGTLRESASELVRVYGLRVFRLPLRLPLQRQVMPPRVFGDRPALWRAVAARVGELGALGRPVLVGTDSVADSESLAHVLDEAGIRCRVLNARQDREEAEVVVLAGLRAQVTVTTNMAGRGTDIPLGPGVDKLGGLHVISCQHNSARRIDRQLLGRCARQGHPGSVEAMLSLDSDLFLKHWPASWLERIRQALEQSLARRAALVLARVAQRREEAREAAARWRLLRADEQIERQLAFGGQTE